MGMSFIDHDVERLFKIHDDLDMKIRLNEALLREANGDLQLICSIADRIALLKETRLLVTEMVFFDSTITWYREHLGERIKRHMTRLLKNGLGTLCRDLFGGNDESGTAG